MEPLNEHDELKRGAPTLFELPKADPFVVPEGFFERFPHEVQARIVSGNNARPIWTWWKRMAIALPLLALVSAAIWWSQQENPLPGDIAEVSIIPLTDAELDELGDNELLALAEEPGITGNAMHLGDVGLTLQENELLAYLENENADLDELLSELE